MSKFIHKVIHNATAKICEDIEQPPGDVELKEPQPIRRYARLVAIAAAGAFLVAAIVVMALRIPKLQSEKTGFSSNSTQEVEKCLRDAVNKNHTIICPCQTQVMSWCNFTTFSLQTTDKDANSTTFSKVFNYTNSQGGDYLDIICDSPARFRGSICTNIMSPVLNIYDSRTFLPTTSAFIDPRLLYSEIATRIDTGAYELSSTYSFLEMINETENFNYTQAVTRLLRQMVKQFLKNSSSSLQDYWIASQDLRGEYNRKTSYGMDVSWERYLQICNPSFCDEQFPISIANRVLRAMGQVGGVTTVITLALKFVIWPSIRFCLRFPTSKLSPASNAN